MSFVKIQRDLEKAGLRWCFERLYFIHLSVYNKGELVLHCRGSTKTECWQKVKNWLKLQTQMQEDGEEFCFT